MHHASLSAFASKAGQLLGPKGPYALVMLEDDVAVTETIAHCRKVGFSEICLFGTGDVLPDDDHGLHLIHHDMHAENALTTAVNGMIDALPGAWLFYCFNAEFYFFPFCETRSVRELVTFTTEERRDAVLSYVVDLYSNDLGQFPNAVSRETAHFDKEGYYALARRDAQGQPIERQLDFHGGLRWRFEEHVPEARRKIDRVSLFRAKPGLELRADHTFNDAEYNTYALSLIHI